LTAAVSRARREQAPAQSGDSGFSFFIYSDSALARERERAGEGGVRLTRFLPISHLPTSRKFRRCGKSTPNARIWLWATSSIPPRANDECVHHAGAGSALQNDDRIQVELGDVVAKIMGEPGEPHDEVDQRFAVSRRQAPRSFEDTRAAQLAYHLLRLALRHRRGAIRHILQHFDVDTAEADRDHGTENGVADD